MSTIAVDQALHGYDSGHHLLATSLRLESEIGLEIAQISDLSGPEPPRDFTYLTGYYVGGSLQSYVFAKTWYAKEISRPNAVWTHSLFVQHDDLAIVRSLGQLATLFKRPSYAVPMGATIMPYEERLWLDLDLLDSSQHLDDSDTLTDAELAILDRFYLWSQFPTIVIDCDTETARIQVEKIWSRQWAGLRTAFSFCTGSLSLRRFNGVPLSLQFFPPTSARRNIRDFTAPHIVNYRGELPRLTEWERLIVPRFWNAWKHGFAQFCSHYAGFEVSERIAMPALYEIYSDLSHSNVENVGRDYSYITTLFERPGSVLDLKRDWLRAIVDQPPPREWTSIDQIVTALLTDEKSMAFTLVVADLRDVFSRLAVQERAQLLTIIDKACREPMTPVGYSILELLGLKEQDWKSLRSFPGLLGALAAQSWSTELDAKRLRTLPAEAAQVALEHAHVSERERRAIIRDILEDGTDPASWLRSSSSGIVAREMANIYKDRKSPYWLRKRMMDVLSEQIWLTPALFAPADVNGLEDAEFLGLLYGEGLQRASGELLPQATRVAWSTLGEEVRPTFAVALLNAASFKRNSGLLLEIISQLLASAAYSYVSDELWRAFRWKIKSYVADSDRKRALILASIEIIEAAPTNDTLKSVLANTLLLEGVRREEREHYVPASVRNKIAEACG